MNKYDLTDETVEIDGATLHRIRALRDFGDAKSGDIGGFIEAERNLSHDGNAQVFGDACVFGDAQVSGNAQVFGRAQVSDGLWRVSPYYSDGSRYPVTTSSTTEITIGCKTATPKKWLGKFGEELAKKENFSEEETAEYRKCIEEATEFLKNLGEYTHEINQ